MRPILIILSLCLSIAVQAHIASTQTMRINNDTDLYNRILSIWESDAPFERAIGTAGFWLAANSFEALIDYLVLNNKRDDENLVTKALAFFKKANPETDPSQWGYWTDDYGWHGRLFLKIHENYEALGHTDPSMKIDLFVYALKCWEKMNSQWNTDGNGGIYNVSPDKSSESRKNSITNTLYLLLSAKIHLRLYKPNERSKYSDAAWDTFNWLIYGKTGSKSPAPYLWKPFNNFGCLLETPNSTSLNHSPDWFWSGDQGILLDAIYHVSKLLETDYESEFLRRFLDSFAEKIIAQINPILFVDPDGIFHESNCSDNFATTYGPDYAGGKGIAISSLGAFNRALGTGKFTKFLQANSRAFFSQLDRGTPFPLNWNPNYGPYEQGPPRVDGLWELVLLTQGLNAYNSQIDPAK